VSKLLDSARKPATFRALHQNTLTSIMGQQLNKVIKRRRRAAYLKRKHERAKAEVAQKSAPKPRKAPAKKAAAAPAAPAPAAEAPAAE
jgi:hypothetical protein